jgi:hypothetical protein
MIQKTKTTVLFICLIIAGIAGARLDAADTPTENRIDADHSATIVLGLDATEPEEYAAVYFQTQVKRRFKVELPIVSENEIPESASVLFVLGQKKTNQLLDRLAEANGIRLDDQTPGFDGFTVRTFDSKIKPGTSRRVVLVAGGNPRGVIYGQNWLVDQIYWGENGQPVWKDLKITDRPVIAWRGRPHSVLAQHLEPGVLDAYLRAGMNFTDVRDNSSVKATKIFPAQKASMGLPTGEPLDVPQIKRMIDQSHRRGLFVYGTVSCSAKNGNTDAPLKTFRELIELGVDGLWLSFDDTGAGKASEEIVRRTLALGREHGMTGRKIAVTPPEPEYKKPEMAWNATAISWGLENAQWFYTSLPGEKNLAETRKNRLKSLPGWWHNLVCMPGGFLHNGHVLCSLRAERRPAYVNLQPITGGWHSPTYDRLRDANKYTDCVLLWGVCNGWPEEYFIGMIGRWAWNPAKADWPETRRSIYAELYGPAQVAAAIKFDDQLAELKDRFVLPTGFLWGPREEKKKPIWPPQLKKLADRPAVIARLDQLDLLAKELCEKAPAETLIDRTRLEHVYLEPMRKTLEVARKLVGLDFPEYHQEEVEAKIKRLLAEGKEPEARQQFDRYRAEVMQQIDQIESTMTDLRLIESYRDHWQQRIGTFDKFKEITAKNKSTK